MSKSSKFGLGVIFGAIAGAVAALLSAPKSGKETREELKKAADNFGADAEKKLKSLHAEANKLIEKCEAEGKKLTGSAKKDADATLEKANQLKGLKKWITKINASRLKKHEIALAKKVKALWFVSKEDMQRYLSFFDEQQRVEVSEKCSVRLSTLPQELFIKRIKTRTKKIQNEIKKLLFVGNLKFHPNQQSLIWILDHLCP